jgi:hypothetical protein
MTTFTIDTDNNIAGHAAMPAAQDNLATLEHDPCASCSGTDSGCRSSRNCTCHTYEKTLPDGALRTGHGAATLRAVRARLRGGQGCREQQSCKQDSHTLSIGHNAGTR